MANGPSFELLAQDYVIFANLKGSLAAQGRFFTKVCQWAAAGDFDKLKGIRWIGRIKPEPRGPRQRPAVPKAIRRQVFERDMFECRLCGSPDRLELDHVQPYSRGGTHEAENLQVLCVTCNRRKSNKVSAS